MQMPRIHRSFALSRIAILLVACLTPAVAHAYVDPGAGMMLLQGIVAAVGAVMFVVGRPFRWLRAKLKSLRRRDAGS